MAMPQQTPTQVNKAVVAYLDGRRLKGHIYNFSAVKESFSIFPEKDPLQHPAREVKMEDLKAVFFVKDFTGHPGHRRSYDIQPAGHARRLEVAFHDGEKIVGITEGYNPKKPGFFLFPVDPEDNNIRVFVVNKNVRGVRWI